VTGRPCGRGLVSDGTGRCAAAGGAAIKNGVAVVAAVAACQADDPILGTEQRGGGVGAVGSTHKHEVQRADWPANGSAQCSMTMTATTVTGDFVRSGGVNRFVAPECGGIGRGEGGRGRGRGRGRGVVGKIWVGNGGMDGMHDCSGTQPAPHSANQVAMRSMRC
jgi:hypothetical protein